MKKRSIIILVLMALMFGMTSVNQVKAQVFIMDKEEEAYSDRIGTNDPGNFFIWPEHDETWDLSYAPLGDGLLLLGCLGGAYLLGKRRKKDDE